MIASRAFLLPNLLKSFIRCSSNSSAVLVEEEWFEENLEEKNERPNVGSSSELEQIESTSSLENVVKTLVGQKAKDLFVFETDSTVLSPYDYQIVCSAYNARQASSIAGNLRKLLKLDGGSTFGQAKTSTKRSNGWFVNEVNQIQIHVMSEECREKYDLESLWLGLDEFREESDLRKDNIMLPPSQISDNN